MDTIHTAMSKVADSTHDGAKGIDQIRENMATISKDTKNFLRIADENLESAKALDEMMKQFKI